MQVSRWRDVHVNRFAYSPTWFCKQFTALHAPAWRDMLIAPPHGFKDIVFSLLQFFRILCLPPPTHTQVWGQFVCIATQIWGHCVHYTAWNWLLYALSQVLYSTLATLQYQSSRLCLWKTSCSILNPVLRPGLTKVLKKNTQSKCPGLQVLSEQWRRDWCPGPPIALWSSTLLGQWCQSKPLDCFSVHTELKRLYSGWSSIVLIMHLNHLMVKAQVNSS